MTILHVIGNLGTGGAERSLERLVLAPIGGARHAVVTLGDDGGTIATRLRERGIDVSSVGLTRAAIGPALGRLRVTIARLRPAVVHGWMHHANVFVSLATPRHVPHLWAIRTMAQPWREKPATAAAMVGSVLWARRPAAIVYNSHAARRTHERMGYPEGRGVVVHNGYDVDAMRTTPEATARWRDEAGIPADAPLLLQLGRYHPVKGHTFLLETLRGALPAAWHVALVGRADGVSHETLRGLAEQGGFGDRLHLVPQQADVAPVLAAADLAVVPSRWGESFPNAVAEAMAAGTAVIASDLGDTREIVGETGDVVSPADRAAWRSALTSATQRSREALAVQGERARDRIAERFGLGRFTTHYHDVLADVVAGRRPA